MKEEAGGSARARLRVITPMGLVTVLPTVLVFVAQTVVFKNIQLGQMDSGSVFSDALLAAAPDGALALFFGLVALLLISRERAALRISGRVLFALAALVFMVLQAADHAYFMATGSNLSYAAVDIWLSHTEETNKVIAGDAMSWRLPLVIAQGAAVLLAAIGPIVGPWGRALGKRGPLGGRGWIVAAVLWGGAALALALMPSLPGAKMALSRSVPLSIIAGGMAGEDDGQAEDVEKDLLATTLRFKEDPEAPRPNIVLILFESLNWKSSDVYTEGRGTTPFLASIADDSLVVDKHYSILPHTSKAILPALCGVYPYMGRKRRESTPDIIPRRCAAHVLRSQGYQTAFFQPAMDFENRSRLVKNMGFHTFAGAADLPKAGFEDISYFGREDKVMVEPSMEWVDSVRDDSPFFLTYMTLATHHNYVTPVSFPKIDFPEEDPDHRNYLNAIRYVDDFIKEVFAAFEERGLMDNTVFLIVGDHGEAFVEHNRRQHDLIMWEEGLRVLSMIYAPWLFEEGGHIEGIRSHLDLVPTICDMLGLELVDGEFEGASLLSPPQKDRKLLYSCLFDRQCMAMREGDVKTIFHYGTQPMEVYNNASDEFDEHDLAGELPYDEQRLEKTKREMLAWRKTINARYDTWEKNLSEGKITKEEPPVARRSDAVFGKSFRLVGYDVDVDQVAAGGDVRVTQVFECLEAPASTMEIFAHVIRGKSAKFVNADHVPVSGSHPVNKWKAGEFITDEYTVHIPSDWAGTEARLSVGFWDKKTGKRLPVGGEKVQVDDNRLVYATIPVKKARRKAEPTEEELRAKVAHLITDARPEVEVTVDAVFGDTVKLVGVDRRRMDVKLAGTVELDYFFEVLKAIPENWRLSVRLEPVEAGGKTVRDKHKPLGGVLPMSRWRPGDFVHDEHKIHIDMYKSKVGRYEAWLGFVERGKPVPVTAPEGVRTDERGRVMIGEVTINPRTERQ